MMGPGPEPGHGSCTHCSVGRSPWGGRSSEEGLTDGSSIREGSKLVHCRSWSVPIVPSLHRQATVKCSPFKELQDGLGTISRSEGLKTGRAKGEHVNSSQGSLGLFPAGILPQRSRNHNSCYVSSPSVTSKLSRSTTLMKPIRPSSAVQSYHRLHQREAGGGSSLGLLSSGRSSVSLTIRKLSEEDELVFTTNLSLAASRCTTPVSIISSFNQNYPLNPASTSPPSPSQRDTSGADQRRAEHRLNGRSFTANKESFSKRSDRPSLSSKPKTRMTSKTTSETTSKTTSDTTSRFPETHSASQTNTSKPCSSDRKFPPQQEVLVRGLRTLKPEPRGTKVSVTSAESSKNPVPRPPQPAGSRTGRRTIMGTLQLQKELPSPYSKLTAPRRTQCCSSDSSSVLSGDLPPAMGRSALFYSSSSSSSGYHSLSTRHTTRSPRKRHQGVLRTRSVRGTACGGQSSTETNRGRCDVML